MKSREKKNCFYITTENSPNEMHMNNLNVFPTLLLFGDLKHRGKTKKQKEKMKKKKNLQF